MHVPSAKSRSESPEIGASGQENYSITCSEGPPEACLITTSMYSFSHEKGIYVAYRGTYFVPSTRLKQAPVRSGPEMTDNLKGQQAIANARNVSSPTVVSGKEQPVCM